MQFDEYYQNQSGGGLPVFQGYSRQKGHGLGNIFKSFYKWIIPIMKTHAMPVLKEGASVLKNEALKTVSNIATDALAGKQLSEAAKERTIEAVNSLSERVQQKGSGIKRKRKTKLVHFSKKRFEVIFD
jgi:hypothetical protein